MLNIDTSALMQILFVFDIGQIYQNSFSIMSKTNKNKNAYPQNILTIKKSLVIVFIKDAYIMNPFSNHDTNMKKKL